MLHPDSKDGSRIEILRISEKRMEIYQVTQLFGKMPELLYVGEIKKGRTMMTLPFDIYFLNSYAPVIL